MSQGVLSMVSIRLQTHVGKDGILRLEVPLDISDTDVDVEIAIQQTPAPEETDELGWPIGFFEETYGSLADDPIERPPQGELEVRDEIE
jgi:hypothetical protein